MEYADTYDHEGGTHAQDAQRCASMCISFKYYKGICAFPSNVILIPFKCYKGISSLPSNIDAQRCASVPRLRRAHSTLRYFFVWEQGVLSGY